MAKKTSTKTSTKMPMKDMTMKPMNQRQMNKNMGINKAKKRGFISSL